MKKVIIISLFVLGMVVPNISAKAVEVSNEDELRAAIEQGGDINLTQDIVITQPLVIDKDVHIDTDGYDAIMMQGDNTLMTINSGNLTLGVDLIAGWSGEYYTSGDPKNDVVKDQGTALVLNGGAVNLDYNNIKAGKLGLEVNNGTVTGNVDIEVGKLYYTYPGIRGMIGGQGMIVNGGDVELNGCNIYSGGTALTVNKGSNINLVAQDNDNGEIRISSYERNGIEVNDGSIVKLANNAELGFHTPIIFGMSNAIYLNGGTANLSGLIDLSSSDTGHGIYINKGINTSTKGDVLNLKNDFIFGYGKETASNFSIYINPDITELRVTDEKGFLGLLNNKLNLGFCSNTYSLAQKSEDEKKAICENLNANLDGPIESNELGKCTAVYINGVKQKDADASCNPVTDNKNEPSQVVNVPATSAYASIIIITLGILCVVVSVIVTRRVTRKVK